jgi:imidazolonepropionase-like amidohydrolase
VIVNALPSPLGRGSATSAIRRLMEGRRRLRDTLLGVLLLALASPCARAQSLFIHDARIFTGIGDHPIEPGHILIREGRVIAVGSDVTAPAGTPSIDATGKQVTPGLVSSYTNLGVAEIVAMRETVDNVTSIAQLGASFSIVPALNPRSSAISYNRAHGLTTAIVMPESGANVFAGQAAAIRLGGVQSFLIDGSVAVFATLGRAGGRLAGGSRAAAFMSLRQTLLDAAEYDAHRAAVMSRRWRELSASPQDLEALLPVLRGRKPLVVAADRASDLRALLQLKKELGLRLVIAGAGEAWQLADELAAADVPVIIDPMANLPTDFDHLGARDDSAAILSRARVLTLFCAVDFSGLGSSSAKYQTHVAHLVRMAAGNAVAHGMPPMEALRSMTVNPAREFGFADRLGTLEPGKLADLVIWSGDPFELLTRAEHVVVHGRLVPMSSRSTELRERYRIPARDPSRRPL